MVSELLFFFSFLGWSFCYCFTILFLLHFLGFLNEILLMQQAKKNLYKHNLFHTMRNNSCAKQQIPKSWNQVSHPKFILTVLHKNKRLRAQEAIKVFQHISILVQYVLKVSKECFQCSGRLLSLRGWPNLLIGYHQVPTNTKTTSVILLSFWFK